MSADWGWDDVGPLADWWVDLADDEVVARLVQRGWTEERAAAFLAEGRDR